MININDFVQITSELAPLSKSAVRLANLISQSDSDTSEIVDVITLDPALTLNLLRAANSAASNPISEITTVKNAVVRLGLGTVLSLAIGKDIKKQMDTSETQYDDARMWQHSVAAALAAEQIRSFCSEPIPPETFTSALLHDIGKLLMGRYISPEYQGKIKDAISNGVSVDKAEFEIFDNDHAELGGIVAREWELPETIVSGIAWHHSPHDFIPDPGGFKIIPYVVCLADAVAKNIGASIEDYEAKQNEHAIAQKYLGIDDKNFDIICERTKEKLKEIGSHYS